VTSRLPCHATCLFDAAGRHELRELYTLGVYRHQVDLAAALGISIGILRAVLA
jgi:hypothetical protein